MEKYVAPKNLDDLHRRELGTFQKAFTAGNEAGLFDGLVYCKRYKVPLPTWALDASIIRQREVIFGEYKRRANWLRQFKQDMIDFERAEAIAECREHGVPWKTIYEVAVRMLERSRTGSQGKPDAIAKSYKRFQRRTKTDPWRYYIPRYIRRAERSPGPGLKEWAEWFEKTFPATTDPKTGETIRRYK